VKAPLKSATRNIFRYTGRRDSFLSETKSADTGRSYRRPAICDGESAAENPLCAASCEGESTAENPLCAA